MYCYLKECKIFTKKFIISKIYNLLQFSNLMSLNLVERIKHLVGKTREVRTEFSELINNLGMIIEKRSEQQELVIGVRNGDHSKVLRCRNMLAYRDLSVGMEVEVAHRAVYNVAYDYANGDYSRKIEVTRIPSPRQVVSIRPVGSTNYVRH